MPGVSTRSGDALDRLGRRAAHVLLLERQTKLLRERPLELRRSRGCSDADEADARLDGDDEQVDQVGELLVDLRGSDPSPAG